MIVTEDPLDNMPADTAIDDEEEVEEDLVPLGEGRQDQWKEVLMHALVRLPKGFQSHRRLHSNIFKLQCHLRTVMEDFMIVLVCYVLVYFHLMLQHLKVTMLQDFPASLLLLLHALIR